MRRTRAALSLLLLCLAACACLAQTATQTPPKLAAQKTNARSASAFSSTPRKASAPADASRTPDAQAAAVPAAWRAALDSISADSMRGHLSFIASDLLEGRDTPSRGLDIAAEYIAAQFRRAGLEPAGDDGYFQTANWGLAARDMSGFRMAFAGTGSAAGVGDGRVSVGAERVSIGTSVAGFNLWSPESELALGGAGLLKVDFNNSSALTREQVAGKVVLTELPDLPRGDRARAFQVLREENDFLARVRALGSPLVVAFDRAEPRGAARGAGGPRLVDPEAAGTRPTMFGDAPTAPLVTVHGAETAHLFDSLPAGAGSATINIRVPAPTQAPIRVRNVAGILRGSDPTLKESYVIVSAHYDHLGVREPCDRQKEDCVYNGANDDGSGTVGVVEMAAALSRLNPRPRRSVLFIAFFGEEKGLLGSRYYGRHPLVPLARTVAQVNLEQIGRTDDSEGPQVGTAAVTGFDYSDLGATLERAGALAGVRFYKHPTKSDAYFARSDNQSLADAGVPAHTVGVAFEFPDYHGVGDEWPKVDFANMERVVRAVTLGVLTIADSPREPRWNEQNPKAAPYVEAWKKLHGK